MALMRSGKSTVEIAAMGWFAALFVAIPAVLAQGQRTYAYHTPATVSVSTLQVPAQAWKHFEKARSLALKNHAAEAEAESGKALAIAPSFAAAHILQASQQLALREFGAAIANVAAARKTEPDAQWSGLILAGAYNSLHRYDEAMDAVLALQGTEAESWQAKYEHARAAMGLNDVEEALTLSAEAYEAAPRSFTDAILVRANALMLAHRWTEASDKLYAYLSLSGPQLHREQAQAVLEIVTKMAKSDHKAGVAMASR